MIFDMKDFSGNNFLVKINCVYVVLHENILFMQICLFHKGKDLFTFIEIQ